MNCLPSLLCWRCNADFNGFDCLTVHERLPIFHFDEHRSELALPQVSKYALCGEGQVGLPIVASPSEDFLEQWSVHGELVRRPRRWTGL